MIKFGAAGIVPQDNSSQSDRYPSPESQPPPSTHSLPVPNIDFQRKKYHDNATSSKSQTELPGPAKAHVQQREPPSVAISTSTTPQPNPSGRYTPRASKAREALHLHKAPPKSKTLFACSECDLETPSRRYYGDHMWNVHSIKVFECPDCGYRAARYDNLQSHGRYCKSKEDQVRKRVREPVEVMQSRMPKRAQKSIEAQSEIQEESWESTEARSKRYKRVRVSIRDLHSPSLKTRISRELTTSPDHELLVATPSPPPADPPETPQENSLNDPSRIVLESVTTFLPQPQSPSPQIRSQNDSEHSDPTTMTSLSTVSELKTKFIALEEAWTTLDQEYSSLKAAYLSKVAKLEALQEDLEQVRSDCDVWYNECRKLRQENRRLREES